MNAYSHQMKYIKDFISKIYVFPSDETSTFFISFSFSGYLFIYLQSLYCVHLSAWESASLSKIDNESMIRTDAIEFHILPKHQTRKEHIKLA